MGKGGSRGSALAMVIIFMAVLMILVISLGTLSNSETKLSAHQLNRTQAYYAARSGVQIGIERVKAALSASSFKTVAELYEYDNLHTIINGSVTPGGTDTFHVDFSKDDSNSQIKITGIGTSREVTNSTAVTIEFSTPFGEPNGWVNNGDIIVQGNKMLATAPVVIGSPKLVGHPIKKSTSVVTSWTSPAIHFINGEYSLQITAKTLTLNSDLVSFRYPVYIKGNKTGDLNDSLILNTFSDDGYNFGTVPKGWGVVALEQGIYSDDTKSTILALGYYRYTDGMWLMDSTKRIDTTRFVKITDDITINHIKATIKAHTSLSFRPTQMRWSKD